MKLTLGMLMSNNWICIFRYEMRRDNHMSHIFSAAFPIVNGPTYES